MGRLYTISEFMDVVKRMKEKVEDLTLSTDIIIGFPKETEERFESSCSIIEKLEPNIVNITRFSARPGTIAERMSDQVVGWKAKERSRKLTEIAHKISLKKNERKIGRMLPVLLTEREKADTTMGRSQSYTPVIVPGEHPLVSVERLLRITGDLQKGSPDLPIVGTGYSWLRHHFPHVGAGIIKEGRAAFIGVGRNAFAYPDFAKDLATRGALDPDKVCIACSSCSQIMRDGGCTGCIIRDKKMRSENRTILFMMISPVNRI